MMARFFEADKVLENAMPEYQGNTPLKAKTDQYTYTFKGWDKNDRSGDRRHGIYRRL
jgi:hypothetical protein